MENKPQSRKSKACLESNDTKMVSSLILILGIMISVVVFVVALVQMGGTIDVDIIEANPEWFSIFIIAIAGAGLMLLWLVMVMMKKKCTN